jgi:hypothetical protein
MPVRISVWVRLASMHHGILAAVLPHYFNGFFCRRSAAFVA